MTSEKARNGEAFYTLAIQTSLFHSQKALQQIKIDKKLRIPSLRQAKEDVDEIRLIVWQPCYRTETSATGVSYSDRSATKEFATQFFHLPQDHMVTGGTKGAHGGSWGRHTSFKTWCGTIVAKGRR